MRSQATTSAAIVAVILSSVLIYVRLIGKDDGQKKTHFDYLKKVNVKNASMSYVDTGGESEKIVIFLHGNPTSSYLWRNIYPNIAPIGRCFAPDLIGMGRSDKVPNLEYRFVDHYTYLSEWIDKVIGDKKVNLVIHDWGSALGFHWAHEHRERVESIIHMESLVRPIDSFALLGEEMARTFRLLRSPAGDEMVLENNVFIEKMLPSLILRNLTEAEMNEYRRPYVKPGEDRRPTLTFPREIPIRGEGPDDVIAAIDAYYMWLKRSASIPKLLISANPGFSSSVREKLEHDTEDWPNHEVVRVHGSHFLQEDSPEEISQAIHVFLHKIFSRPKHDSYHETIRIKGSEMSYADTGGDSKKVVVFLHGNPTSSYLWRNIYPNIAPIARCLAPDLIGMGRSAKVPNITYTFAEHYEYLSEWMDKIVGDKKVNLVIHDWGSALGFHWANQHREQVESITYMEAIVKTLESISELFEDAGQTIQAFRTPAGETLVLENNAFVESLQIGVIRKLTNDDMNEYRRPFASPGEDRRPTLTWPREIPVRGDGPDDVIVIVDSYNAWLSKSASIPKLFIKAIPGTLTPMVEETTRHWPNQRTASVRGLHFMQEDSPNDISDKIFEFLTNSFNRRTHLDYLKRVDIKDSFMSYVDTGGSSDRAVVFMHGNPTSSFLWRNIYPNIAPIARCFAPDLIGMGRSGKLKNSTYRVVDHFEYLSEWYKKVVLSKFDKVNLVLHDWGSGLGFYWADMNRDKVQSIVHMESIVGPFNLSDVYDPEIRENSRRFRTSEGEQMMLDRNMAIEWFLPDQIIRNLTDEEMAEYRRPFINRKDRIPTLTFERETPIIELGPADVVAIAQSYFDWLSQSVNIPKLLIAVDQGVTTALSLRRTKDWLNQTITTVRGKHYAQEDSPNDISDAIYNFLRYDVFKMA